MKNWYLLVVVFVSGAAVLAIEILGTRLLGPFYGVSLFLWSALITVTLVALSAGYVLGGRLADKNCDPVRLYAIVGVAGLWVVLTPWLRQAVLPIAESFGLRTAVLLAAFVLFTPSLMLLGMVSPFAIRVRASSLAVVGRTAGDLYAFSTLGSVISALLTGFILIPNVGVNRLTVFIGAVLLFMAAVGFVIEQKRRSVLAAAVIVLVGGLFALWGLSSGKTASENVLTIRQSPYAEIRVVDMNERRHLVIDGGIHTIVDPRTWESYFPYTAVIDMTRASFAWPGKMLLIGLGGGTLVKSFASAGWSVDAVEIDPVVIDVARTYLGLEEQEGRIFEMDGRRFLQSSTEKYDVIVMDAFGSSSIPFHLVTEEAFGLIADRLTPDGIFAINLESRAWDDLLVRSLAATLQPHFAKVLALPAHGDSEGLGNMVLFAANREFAPRAGPPQWKIPPRTYLASLDYRRDFAWSNRFVPETSGAPVLTDDLNPVDLWAEGINLVARKGLHTYFADKGLSW